MILSSSTISPEEQEQILQTIEMFEVIIQASPQDCQSMEILKEAYLRVGRTEDASAIAKRLADAYLEQGQLSQAMLEYEAVLQLDPGNSEVISAMSELEERLTREQLKSPGTLNPASLPDVLQPNAQMLDASEIEYQTIPADGPTLIATSQTQGAERISAPKLITPGETTFSNEGNEALGKFLVQHRLVPDEVVSSALDRVAKKNSDRQPHVMPISLIDEICRRGSVDLETLLCGIIDRSKFAYIPLEYYDVDRAVVRMLPENLCIERLLVPFDIMSRTVMIATANPFDAAAKETAQQLLDYNIQWHLAAPQAISQVLSSVYKVGAAPEPLTFRLSA